MEYKLGVIGLGHWFNRLNVGIQKVGGLTLVKAAGTKPYEQKIDLLTSFKIGKDNYYISDEKGKVPEDFFIGIDLVHISDPNKLHASQTKEALLQGKYAITEKSFAGTKREFNKISSFIKKNNYENKAYLHLHYMHKQPTLILKAILPGLIRNHGKIKSVHATFFEKENEEDARRGWLFAPENGGIFMDWIHPFEILYYAAEAGFGNIRDLSIYAVNPAYDKVNPTGVQAVIALKGKYYAPDAAATINVAKGVKNGNQNKSIKIIFESGKYTKLCYVGSEIEFGSDERGTLEVGETRNGNNKILMSSRLSGPNSSEIFVEDILGFVNGENMGFTFKDITKVFKPQWEYQKIVKSRELITENSAVEKFVQEALEDMKCGPRLAEQFSRI